MKLKNKVAIITGASRGIGFAVAEAFLLEGARVAVCGSRIETAQSAVERLASAHPDAELLPIGVRTTDTGEICAMVASVVAKWGRVDILVNNAGITSSKEITEMTDDDFDSILAVNLAGPFRCIRETARVMKEQGGGVIINTSSIAGVYAVARQSAYASSKWGINGLTKACARELGPFGIRVNAVAPGVVLTDMVAQAVSPQMLEGLRQVTPMGRPAQPSEIVGAYVYLASDDASFTTGAILHVDGGIVM